LLDHPSSIVLFWDQRWRK